MLARSAAGSAEGEPVRSGPSANPRSPTLWQALHSRSKTLAPRAASPVRPQGGGVVGDHGRARARRRPAEEVPRQPGDLGVAVLQQRCAVGRIDRARIDPGGLAGPHGSQQGPGPVGAAEERPDRRRADRRLEPAQPREQDVGQVGRSTFRHRPHRRRLHRQRLAGRQPIQQDDPRAVGVDRAEHLDRVQERPARASAGSSAASPGIPDQPRDQCGAGPSRIRARSRAARRNAAPAGPGSGPGESARRRRSSRPRPPARRGRG